MATGNGSAFDITLEIARKAIEQNCPNCLKVTVSALSPEKEPSLLQNAVNGELKRRMPQYTILEPNEITYAPGFVIIELHNKSN